jgi:dTDP-4-dehydrorhamnose reductase
MRIFVLGSTGMLGRYVFTYLNSLKKYDVVGVTRKMVDATKVRGNSFTSIVKGDVVINCIGVIKQRNKINPVDFILANSAFPWRVANHCEHVGAKFIHVTTDCVFSGAKGAYNEESLHDAIDIYGRTKSLGEPDNCCVIRTSIIGEELRNKVSLLEWVKSNEGKTVNGYTNHFWNGITCLTFAKICDIIIKENLYWEGVKHLHSPDSFNKYELTKLISDVFSLDVVVNEYKTIVKCDRTLSSIYSAPKLDIPPLKQQLEKLKEYGPTLRGE